jgi:hypothetical protein
MSTTTTRTPFLIAGIVTVLIALGLLIAGGALLYGNSKKDDDGYLNTGAHRLHATTYAMASDDLDLDLDGVSDVLDADDMGTVRVKATSNDGQPIFVGIARTTDLDAYLGDVEHTTVTDVDFDPFEADYRREAGTQTPAPPATRTIWQAASHGTGTQAFTWDVRDGNWSVVVMNEDGSRNVDADVKVGAKLPWLAAAGWTVLGGGVLALVIAGTLIYVGANRRSGLQGSVPAQPSAAAA